MIRSVALFILLLSASAITHVANAEYIPRSSYTDRHVQVATYDPNQVFKVFTMQGYITAVQFGPDEKVISVNIGDSSSWLVNVQNDVINLKPVADYPDTNMNVLTTRGTYQFFLTAPPPVKSAGSEHALRKPHPNTAFLVRFRYPNDPLTPNIARSSGPENWHYSAQGDPTVVPVCVYDNQRFTFFDFGDRKDIPAIFSVDPSGRESLVNYHMQGKFVAVETTSKQFTLRNGEKIATVFNEDP